MTTQSPTSNGATAPLRGAAARIAEVQSGLAARGAQHIGDLVSWNAEGIDVPRDKGLAVFEAAGMGVHWPAIEPGTALYRGVQNVRPPRPKKDAPGPRLDTRAFARPNPDTPVAYGVYQVDPRDGESGDRYTCGARVRVDPNSKVVVAMAPEDEPAIDEALALANRIADEANHLIRFAESRDVTNAMVGVIKVLCGVPFRTRGGVYLVPPSKCGVWRAMLPGLRELGVDPITVDMYDSPLATVAAATSAKSALEADIAALRDELKKAVTEGMKKAPLQRRLVACDELSARVDLYRGVLMDTADELLAEAARVREGLARELDSAGGDSSRLGGTDEDAGGASLFDLKVIG